MKRAVVFMGGTRDAAAVFGRALSTCGKVLAESGVVVPRSGRSGNKASGFTHQALGAPGYPAWADLQGEAAGARGDTLLLVIPTMLKPQAETRRAELVRRLSGIADEVVVASVVADQLTLINDAYLHQVATWRTSRRLESLLPKLLDNETFVHETHLRPWYAGTQARYRAVPLPEFLAPHHPVEVVLNACGVELARTPGAGNLKPPAKLGPIGVEADRLLATYLRATIPRFDPAEPAVAAASRAAAARAEKMGWCAEPFWGWNRRAAEKALARFEASNHRFARAVWGSDWTVPYPMERPGNRIDFLDLDVQFIDQVQRYVTTTANRVKRERAASR